jgi:hypothetical protein
VPRIQFLAIEIARNREGNNQAIYHKAQAGKAAEAASSSA